MWIRAESGRRVLGRVAVGLGVLAAVPVVAACGGDTVAPNQSVTVDDLQGEQHFYEGKYLGRTVAVSAEVSAVHGPSSFELSGGDFGDEELLVVTTRPVEVVRDSAVRVTGTVGQLHRSDPSQQVPYVQRGLYTEHQTEAYLYDATVGPLTRSAPPPS